MSANDGMRGATRIPATGCHLSGARFTSQKIWARRFPLSALRRSAASTAAVFSSSGTCAGSRARSARSGACPRTAQAASGSVFNRMALVGPARTQEAPIIRRLCQVFGVNPGAPSPLQETAPPLGIPDQPIPNRNGPPYIGTFDEFLGLSPAFTPTCGGGYRPGAWGALARTRGAGYNGVRQAPKRPGASDHGASGEDAEERAFRTERSVWSMFS
jgi:hypothetical protein